MAVNLYANPDLAGLKFRGANLCNRPNDTGNGDYGTAGTHYDIWYDIGKNGDTDAAWTFLKNQIDAAAAEGCNLIRFMGDATLAYGDATHHGAATWRGGLNVTERAYVWNLVITYCASLGIYVYATLTESRPIAASSGTLAQVKAFCAEEIAIVTSTNYWNVAFVDIVQEWPAGGSVVTSNIASIISDTKAARVRAIPVTCSQNGASSSADLDFDTDANLQTIAGTAVDFIDVHIYYDATITDVSELFGTVPIIVGECGNNYNGNRTSGAADGTSAAKRAASYVAYAALAADGRLQVVAVWAVTRQSNFDGNDWGFTDASFVRRAEMADQLATFPKTSRPRDAAYDPGPTPASAPTVGSVTSTTIPVTWSAADGGTGTKTYVPQVATRSSAGIKTSSWSDGSSTTGTSGTLSGLTPGATYFVRLKVTDSAATPVTHYSPWVAVTTSEDTFMALQFSVAVRNARLDAVETTVGTSAILKIRSGSAPSDCAQADAGTVLATLNLPSDWMAAASAGAKAKSGTWQDASADATGTAAHWRLYASDGVTVHAQGTVTITGGGGDMTVDNTSFASGQSFTITGFTLTDANA